ncbi:hypothetical protein R3P38DRAFT_2806434 [Favolaschia claudopus]|uniref:Uncharacterized protein n=2 Tax=Favolaschia claudopus TaxID=2862362 RepID=A0AAV9ZK91_9AGAR
MIASKMVCDASFSNLSWSFAAQNIFPLRIRLPTSPRFVFGRRVFDATFWRSFLCSLPPRALLGIPFVNVSGVTKGVPRRALGGREHRKLRQKVASKTLRPKTKRGLVGNRPDIWKFYRMSVKKQEILIHTDAAARAASSEAQGLSSVVPVLWVYIGERRWGARMQIREGGLEVGKKWVPQRRRPNGVSG